MATFQFNFSAEDEGESPVREVSVACKARPTPTEVTVTDIHKRTASLARPLHYQVPGADLQLSYLTCDCIRSVLTSSDVDQSDKSLREFKTLLSRSSDTDLIPTVYEGGLVVWEGAFDLVTYLSEVQFDFTGLDVLELGCGSGLPSIYALIKGARSVSLQDYNSEVVNFITIPSLLLNVPEERMSDCHFYSASWGDLSRSLITNPRMFDVILTSETIYCENSQRQILSAIKALLKPSGQVLLAAKTYYFGVGGSVSNFEHLVRSDGHLSVERRKNIDCAVPRVVLGLRCWVSTLSVSTVVVLSPSVSLFVMHCCLFCRLYTILGQWNQICLIYLSHSSWNFANRSTSVLLARVSHKPR